MLITKLSGLNDSKYSFIPELLIAYLWKNIFMNNDRFHIYSTLKRIVLIHRMEEGVASKVIIQLF